jgi:WbqC-like protein family
MRLVALQSNYVPWKGYFDLLNTADLFVVYDSVQYTKNDWRNRNVLICPNGPTWLTIPVQTSGRMTQAISEVQVSDHRWARKHWMTAVQALANRPCFSDYCEQWERLFTEAGASRSLHEINLVFMRGLCAQLSISTPLAVDTDFDLGTGSATDRLVMLCTQAGATTYVTGPAGLDYMELDKFANAQIQVEVIDYSQYPEYSQAGGSFTHAVSVLDLLANVGPDARTHLLGRTSLVC